MKATSKRKQDWPRKVTLGRVSVSIYKRTAPNGSPCFMVANYSGEKRRFDSYASESEAIEEAGKLARQLSARDTISASMTKEECIEYASAIQTLKPLGIKLPAAVAAVAEAVKLTGDLAGMVAAARFYKAKNKTVTAKSVADAVAEMIKIKEARGASLRYIQDLGNRLNRFAADFPCEAGNVTGQAIQAWFDGKKFEAVNFMSFRRVINVLFEFCVQRGYCLDNPCKGVEKLKAKGGDTEIYTPDEINKLLCAASPEYLPGLAIGAFAGLRSAEIERLEWSDVDLAAGFITVGADKAKTASRRIVPICDALAAWLKTYAGRTGKIWQGTHFQFYGAQKDTATAAGVAWKSNALRHSFCSYRLAGIQNAAQVALEAGNSPAMIFRHYRELVRLADALKYFSVKPATALPPASPATV